MFVTPAIPSPKPSGPGVHGRFSGDGVYADLRHARRYPRGCVHDRQAGHGSADWVSAQNLTTIYTWSRGSLVWRGVPPSRAILNASRGDTYRQSDAGNASPQGLAGWGQDFRVKFEAADGEALTKRDRSGRRDVAVENSRVVRVDGALPRRSVPLVRRLSEPRLRDSAAVHPEHRSVPWPFSFPVPLKNIAGLRNHDRKTCSETYRQTSISLQVRQEKLITSTWAPHFSQSVQRFTLSRYSSV